MTRHRVLAAVLAFGLFITNASAASAQPMCKPTLDIKPVRFSDMMINLKRYWWATIDVDASRCADSSGSFELLILRIKENALDLPFLERVGWHVGQKDIVLEFWADEAVLEYRIGKIAACTCRD